MKTIYKTIALIVLLCICSGAFGQAKKPTLMILPSDNWCFQRYYITEFDNFGDIQRTPNYKQAFQEDTELGQVISLIGSLMTDRGFPLKDAEQELKAIETRTAEDYVTFSRGTGSLLDESPLDMLKNRSRADIIIQIWWNVTKTYDGLIVSFVLEAFDAYTSKQIAASSGNSSPNNQDIVPEILKKAILSHINPFLHQLQSHFDDINKNGREIRLTVRRWENWSMYLDDDVDGIEIIDHINDWMYSNTINGMFNMSDATENVIRFEQVRISLFDQRNRAIDARQFARDLQRYLSGPPFNFETKLMTRGLGEAIIVIGEK